MWLNIILMVGGLYLLYTSTSEYHRLLGIMEVQESRISELERLDPGEDMNLKLTKGTLLVSLEMDQLYYKSHLRTLRYDRSAGLLFALMNLVIIIITYIWG